MTPSYRTGSWTGLIGPDGLALLSPDFAPDTVRGLWEAMSSRRPVHAWLEVVADAGLSGLPEFALARTEDGQVRILVRGEVEVEVDGTVIRADGMSTWREHVGPAPTALRISAPESGGQQWPVRHGVVLAASVHTGGQDVAGPDGDLATADHSNDDDALLTAQPAAGDRDLPVEAERDLSAATDRGLPAVADRDLPAVAERDLPAVAERDLSAAGDRDLAEATVIPSAYLESGEEDPVGEQPGDHDGHTVMVADLRAARAGGADPSQQQPEAAAGGPPPRVVPVLALSTGQRVELDRTALIGRGPESNRFAGPVAPHLVTVPSAQQDISRTHLEAAAEGDHVVFTDLHSTNGTVVIIPGADPRRLHAGESVPVGAGAVADLGDGITVTVELPTHGARPESAYEGGGQ